MAAPKLDFPVFDADNHLYETTETFTKFLPKQYQGLIQYVEVKGRTKIMVRGQVSDYIPNPTFDYVAAPGAQEDYFRNGNPEGKSYREILGKPIPCLPGFRNPADRIVLMDELNLDRTLMFPTLASLLEQRLDDSPDLTHIVIHALNEWLYETWGFDYEDRIFTTPVITLPIVDKAIEELEWVIERGAKTVLIRPGPVPDWKGSRSFGLPEFDPFWEAVTSHDILVSMHASDVGFSDYINRWEGTREYLPFEPTAFRWVAQNKRPIEDAMAAMICHGAFTRHPKLKVLLVENGSEWVPVLWHNLREVHRKMPQWFEEDPIEAFKRCVYLSPFHEDDLSRLIDEVGVDHLCFGSDYPHPEGLAEPTTYVDHLPPGLPQEDVAKIMGGNLAALMKVGAAA